MSTAPALPAAERFESAEAVRAAHKALLEELPEPLDPEPVTKFIKKAVSTGTVLDTPEDRKQVQGLIDYWAASLVTASRRAIAHQNEPRLPPTTDRIKPPKTVLAQFDADRVHKVAEEAERWLLSASAQDQQLARRLLLRLVRMPAQTNTFEPVPVTRGTLWTLGPAEKVDKVIDGLAAVQAVRATPSTERGDLVELRYDALVRVWPRYADWLGKRLAFREAVHFWAQHKSEPGQRAALVSGELLREAEKYHDRNEDEEAFIDASRRQEKDNADHDRHWKNVFMVVSIVAIFATVAAVCGWSWAVIEMSNRLRKEHAEQEAIKLDTAAQSASTLAIASLLMSEDTEAVHAAKKVLIIQMLRQLLFARNETERDAALANWKSLEHQLTQKNARLWDWFKGFLQDWDADHGGCREQIELITNSWKPVRPTIDALRKITIDLRKYIAREETKDALNIIRPILMDEAVSVADSINDAAKTGKPLSEVEPYRLAFWRLNSAILIVQYEDPNKDDVQMEFADGLRQWEDVGGKASRGIAESLDRGLNRLRSERARSRPQ